MSIESDETVNMILVRAPCLAIESITMRQIWYQWHFYYLNIYTGGSIGPSSGINIGSEMSGNVYNVMVRDVEFKGALFAGRIKSGRGRGGEFEFATLA